MVGQMANDFCFAQKMKKRKKIQICGKHGIKKHQNKNGTKHKNMKKCEKTQNSKSENKKCTVRIM